MSKYTTEVRYVCESYAGYKESKGFNTVQSILETSAPLVFNFDFPIFDETYRLPLEIKILRHYYTREICEETVGLWKLRLQDRLCMIMPYYNKLYESALLEFDPLHDVDITKDHIGTESGQTDGTGSVTTQSVNNRNISLQEATEHNFTDSGTVTDKGESHSTSGNVRWDLYSDTPQGGINGITNDEDSVENNTYLTNARKIIDSGQNDTGSNDNTRTTDMTNAGLESHGATTADMATGNVNSSNTEQTIISNTDQWLEHIRGKQGTGSFSRMLLEFRETFLNIDAMIIEELSDLFFGLWQ